MSYISDITVALLNVLTPACNSAPLTFAGYGANLEFWVAEAMHCLSVIEGYLARFERMQAAKKNFSGLDDLSCLMPQSPNLTSRDLQAFRQAILDVMTRYLGRCLKNNASDPRPILDAFKSLKLQVPGRSWHNYLTRRDRK